MNKRSAIVVALGLVAALVIGGVGFTMGMTGPAASLASVRDPAPKVRTIHRTVTVHRPAQGSGAAVVGVTQAPTVVAGAVGDDDDGYEDDGYEDDGYEDDGYEDDGYEVGGHAGEDHESEDHGGDDD
jgi:hypothetical protein